MAQPPTTQAPKREDYVPLSQVRSVAQALTHPETLERFKAAAPSHVSPERMVRMTYTAVMNNADLQQCPMWTLLRAALTFGALGIEPNSPLGHGYLIPFKVKGKMQVQSIVGYKGYILLAANAGIKGCHGDVVYTGDDFRYQYGTERGLWHRPRGSRYGRQPAEAYAVMGDEFEVRDWGDVLEIRNRSQGYQAAVRAKEEGRTWAFDANPWVRDPHPMGAKTMIRSVSRFVPMTIQMAAAVEIDGRAEAGHRTDLRDVNTGLDIAFIEGLPEDKEDMSGAVQGAALGQQDAGRGNGNETGNAGASTQQSQQTQTTATDSAAGAARQGQETRQDAGGGQTTGTTETATTDADMPAVLVLYLMGADGDPETHGDTGDFVIWSDAVQWAAALRNRIESAPADQRTAIVEHNADSIEDARAASRDAASILDRMRDLVAMPGLPGLGTIQVVRDSAGRIDVAATVSAVREHVMHCQTVDDLNALDVAVRPIVGELTPAAKRIITQVWKGRLRAIQEAATPPVETSGGTAPTTTEPATTELPPDRDQARVDMLVAELRGTTDVWALDNLTNSTAHKVTLERFERERPDLAVDYRSAVDEHRRNLTQPPGGAA